MKKTRSIWTMLALLVVLTCALATTAFADDTAIDADYFSNTTTLSAGTYYLTEDVSISTGLTISGTVTLYLNDHVLKYTSASSASVITVNSGATLNLYDLYDGGGTGTTTRYWTDTSGLWSSPSTDSNEATNTTTGGVITGGTGTEDEQEEPVPGVDDMFDYSYLYYGGGIYVDGTLNLHSGNIVGNAAGKLSATDSYGAGVHVASNGNFTMFGGSIMGNYSYEYGGGVHTAYASNFAMEGGSITDNATKTYGGGVFNEGTFTMSGGSITGNTVNASGGGVFNNSTFTMSGGSITGNTAGTSGGGLHNNNVLKLSGDVDISDNTKTDGTKNDLYVGYLQKITIAGALDETVKIGVTTFYAPSEGAYQTITSGASGYATADNFTSDADYYVAMVDGEVCLFEDAIYATWAGRASSASDTTDYVVADSGDVTIKTALGLAWLANSVNTGTSYENKTITLAADIDLQGLEWTPIGTSSNAFKGTFDGGGHTVSNLYINVSEDSTYYAGLFGYVDGSTINDVAVEVDITVGVTGSTYRYNYAGGIVGYNDGGGIVSNCYATGSINVTNDVSYGNCAYAGGIVGMNGGTVANCYADVNVTATAENTSTASSARATAYAGGVAGRNNNEKIIYNCYATGAVSATASAYSASNATAYIGGVVGQGYGTMSNCYWLNSSASTGIGSGSGTNCVSFDSNGVLSTTVYETTDLLTALNAWVCAKNSADYRTWVVGTGDYPVFGDYFVPAIELDDSSNTYEISEAGTYTFIMASGVEISSDGIFISSTDGDVTLIFKDVVMATSGNAIQAVTDYTGTLTIQGTLDVSSTGGDGICVEGGDLVISGSDTVVIATGGTFTNAISAISKPTLGDSLTAMASDDSGASYTETATWSGTTYVYGEDNSTTAKYIQISLNVASAITSAETIEEITAAKAAYDGLSDEAKADISGFFHNYPYYI